MRLNPKETGIILWRRDRLRLMYSGVESRLWGWGATSNALKFTAGRYGWIGSQISDDNQMLLL
ncbi:MAG: hypothetical protein KTR25_08105, partial [Myxococcales bacterium]|nr:hypothetical protein [Myxococcales bacterium]